MKQNKFQVKQSVSKALNSLANQEETTNELTNKVDANSQKVKEMGQTKSRVNKNIKLMLIIYSYLISSRLMIFIQGSTWFKLMLSGMRTAQPLPQQTSARWRTRYTICFTSFYFIYECNRFFCRLMTSNLRSVRSKPMSNRMRKAQHPLWTA